MNLTNSNDSIENYEYQKDQINLYYTICEVLVAVFAVLGNALVIFVFRKERRLRRRTNYYIVSLAAADFLVGLLGIPFAILSSIGLPTNLHACLFTVSLLVVLCTISIFCLVAVSVDRYWAILHPMGYSRNVRTKTAIVIISICWVTGGLIGFLPLLGWHKDAPSNARCFFLDVMDYNYLVFLYFGTIITPALLLAAFYAHIYQVVLKQLRRHVTMNPSNGSSNSSSASGGTMLRMLGAAQKREVKATQNLAIIVLFFMICWIPLYTINCMLAFCKTCQVDSTFMFFCIILSHLNSAGNPLLYAYHLKDFRAALKNFFCNLFGYPVENPNIQVPNRTSVFSNNNGNIYKFQPGRAHNNTHIYHRKKSSLPNTEFSNLDINCKKISNIVKNSAALAAAPTSGELSRDIWNIPEGSLGSSSSDSVKRSDKVSMIIRPATPYRPRKSSDNSQVNKAYFPEDNSSDEVFFPDNFPLSDLESNLTDKIRREIKIVPAVTRTKVLSTSSPQLSRNLFFVESSRSVSPEFHSCDLKRESKGSPLRVVERRLSDDGDGVARRLENLRSS